MADLEQQSFETLANAVSNSIYDINSDVKQTRRMLQKLGRDSDPSRKSADLSNRMVFITEKCSNTNKLVDELTAWPAGLLDSAKTGQRKALTNEFQLLLKEVQALQHNFTTSLRIVAKAPPASAGSSSQAQDPDESTPLIQVLDQLDTGALDLHSAIVERRDVEIAEIQRGMLEINTIFKDIAMLTGEQGTQIDTIEENIGYLARQTEDASRELTKAHNYQKQRGKWSCIALSVLLFFTILVAIAIFA